MTAVAVAPRSDELRRLATLTLMLTRPSRQGLAALVLPIVAFAAVTAVLLAVGGGAKMFLTHPTAVADPVYGVLGTVALILLAIPVFTLGAAAARLSSRNRDDRLATLRLLGASSAEVSRMTVIEAGLIAAVGALGGVAVYLVLLPLIGLIPFFGGPVGMGAVGAGVGGTILVVAIVVALAMVSAHLSLKKVRLTPLGVRRRQDPAPRRTKLIVAGLAMLCMAGGLVAMLTAGGLVLVGPMMLGVVLAVLFAGAMAVVNMVGSPILAARGRYMAMHAKTAAKLIAGRELAEHSASAWRRVSAIAMVSFIAVVGGIGLGMMADNSGDQLYPDIRTGIAVTLVCGFVVLAASTGVTQAAAVLEDRALITALDRLGMPGDEIRRARRLAVMVPLRLAAVSGAAVGVVFSLPVAGAGQVISPFSVVVLIGTFAAGFCLMRLALDATRPILAAVRRGETV
ncbi:permease [Microbacterium sp.]|uniref:permease n=1 Tax=Microbacterium sp. TaxID=51671 RepID=UPI0035B0CFCD